VALCFHVQNDKRLLASKASIRRRPTIMNKPPSGGYGIAVGGAAAQNRQVVWFAVVGGLEEEPFAVRNRRGRVMWAHFDGGTPARFLAVLMSVLRGKCAGIFMLRLLGRRRRRGIDDQELFRVDSRGRSRFHLARVGSWRRLGCRDFDRSRRPGDVAGVWNRENEEVLRPGARGRRGCGELDRRRISRRRGWIGDRDDVDGSWRRR